MSFIFKPITRISRLIPIKQKFLILFAVAIVPSLTLLLIGIQDKYVDIQRDHNEIAGLLKITAVAEAGRDTALHRRHTQTALKELAASGAAENTLATVAKIEGELTAKMTGLQKSLDTKLAQSYVTEISEEVQQLYKTWRSLSPAKNHETHRNTLNKLQTLRTVVAGESGLLLDPESNIYFPIDLLVNVLPVFREQLVSIRTAIGTGDTVDVNLLPTLDYISGASLAMFNQIHADLRLYGLAIADQRNVLADEFTSTGACAKEVQTRAGELAQTGTAAERSAFFSKVSNCLDVIDSFSVTLSKKFIASNLNARIEQEKFALIRYIVISALLILLGAWMVVGFGLDLTARGTHLQEMIEHMREGDFSERKPVPGRDEIGRVSESAHYMRGRWTDVVMGLRGQANFMLQASTGLEGITTQLAQNSVAQSENATKIADEVSELSHSIDTISNETNDTGIAVQKAGAVASQSVIAIGGVVSEIRQVATTINQSEQLVKALDERVADIGRIAATIRDIAEQTNLLALNAAIEAARAGDAGRGFSVVADEVRKLAEKTSGSTQSIAGVIKEIRESSSQMVDFIGTCITQANSTAVLSEKAAASMQDICTAANESTERVASVTRLIAQQRENATIVAGRVTSIATMSAANAQMATQVAEASQRVDTIAKAIDTEASYFKLSGT